MLAFFRKYQKIFFFVVAIVTIISFSFFGTYQTLNVDERPSDRKFGVRIGGSAFSEQEVHTLAHLLGKNSHLASECITRDIFEAGLVETLIAPYFDCMKDELDQRLKKIKRFRPYAHPGASFLNAENMWQHFAPALAQDLSLLKMSRDEPSIETFVLLAKTYLDQIAFSPEMLRRMLTYRQNQFAWLPQDPHLKSTDLSLFGFHSLEDWFGTHFLYLMSELIINAADLAEKKGYTIADEEAYADLMQTAYRVLQTGEKPVSAEDALAFLRFELQQSGLDQSGVLALWKKVLLFRRLFSEVGESVFLDPLVHRKFNNFAQEKRVLDLYHLPPHLQLKDFRSLLKLQLYLEAVSPKSRTLTLPTTFFPLAEIEKRFPELVHKCFKVQYAHVSEEALAEEIGLRATWDFELDEKNWDLCKTQFPELARGEQNHVLTREERLAMLDLLNEEIRLKVDRFARHQIIRAHPEMIHEALARASLQEKMLSIKTKSNKPLLQGIEDSASLGVLLEGAPVQEAAKALQCYTQDEENYYRFVLLRQPTAKEIMTFAEALRDEVLGPLLDKRLEEAYPEVRKKFPHDFQLANGGFKPFKEVKDQVGARVYGDLIKLIEESRLLEDTRSTVGSALDTYAHARLFEYVQDAKTKIEAHPETKLWVEDDETTGLMQQWKLVKTREEASRGASLLPQQEIFALPQGAFSEVTPIGAQGDIAFCRVIDKKEEEGSMTDEELEAAKGPLKDAARFFFLKQLLTEIVEKKAIDFSIISKI